MKVYDENKVYQLKEYDLSKGYLKDDVLPIFVETTKGKSINEAILEYKNKGYLIEYINNKPCYNSVVKKIGFI